MRKLRCLFGALVSFLLPFNLMAADLAYVANNTAGTIDIIDTATDMILSTISMGLGAGPRLVAITPNGLTAYVTNQGSNDVSVIDTAINTVTTTISMGIGTTPIGITITPDGTKAYVSNNGSSDISLIDIATNTAMILPVLIGATPNELKVTPDGTELYVLNTGSGDVSIIDVATDTLITTVVVGTNPNGLTFSATSAFVVNTIDNTLSIIDLATHAVSLPIMVDAGGMLSSPFAIAITPDLSKAYIAYNSGAPNIGVYTIGTMTTAVLAVSPPGMFGTGSLAVGVTSDGTKGYVTNIGSANISVIDVATDTVVDTISSTGAGPIGIAFLFDLDESAVSGARKKNVFLTQTELFNEITWLPIGNPVPIEYRIFRNGELVATVPPTGPFVFIDNNRKKNQTDTYIVVAQTVTSSVILGQVSL